VSLAPFSGKGQQQTHNECDAHKKQCALYRFREPVKCKEGQDGEREEHCEVRNLVRGDAKERCGNGRSIVKMAEAEEKNPCYIQPEKYLKRYLIAATH
jgi:hypothetical protein